MSPTLEPSFADFLPGWVARQRWYRTQSDALPQLSEVGRIRLEDPFGEVGMEVHLLQDSAGPEPITYQVPLSYREQPVPFMEHALIATAEHSELGTRYIYDATHDPVFAQTLLQVMYAEQQVPGAQGHRVADQGEAPALASARVLSGEQSNTSVIVQVHRGGEPIIIKLFRVLHAGENPDVVVQSAITRAGCHQVPEPLGYLEGRWGVGSGEDAQVSGHLAFAQEFLPDTQDAWRVALTAAHGDQDFTAPAQTLGAATATVHAALRSSFATTQARGSLQTLLGQMRQRAEQAFASVPGLARHREAVEQVFAGLEHGELGDLQRVHGDYHLGQVLDVPGRGWVLLDFEGEPLRPLRERSEPDLALRDVAGMLRSFDYAAASVQLAGEGDRSAWAAAAREAFLDGYAEESGLDVRAMQHVLDALELDKALYEVSYEAQNRPDWVPIPVSAVERLVGARTAVAAAPADDQSFGAPQSAAASAAVLLERNPAEEIEMSHDDEQQPNGAGQEGVPAAGPHEPDEAQAAGPAGAEVQADAGSEVAGPVPQDSSDDYGSSLIEVERHDDPLSHPPASRTPASGGVPHAPIPAPPEMTIGLVPRAPRTGSEEIVEPGRPAHRSASGWSGVVAGDPEVSRARAWQEASDSPDLVRPAGSPGPGARRPVAEPTEPAAPHTRPLDLEEATDVVHGAHRNPHALLGAHVHDGHVTVRTLQPEADAVEIVLPSGQTVPMRHETSGLWVAVLPVSSVPAYRLKVSTPAGAELVDEAYRHGPSLGQTDLHLIGEGRHEELWRTLGSHVMTVRDELGEVTGTRFAVWAPHALAVHVIGDFNGWNGATHALRAHDSVGVWELFVPGVRAGAHYKFDVTGPDGVRRAKADPMARASEVPPFNNSVVTASSHRWRDEEWMERRAAGDIHHGPMSIYEVHLGSWRQGMDYDQLAEELVAYVSDMGFTHVEFMPVMQHPYGGSWGYHVTSYYAADSRFGHEDGLRRLIDRLHQVGVGVILDWVPGHFATDPWALARFDGTPIYEHPDPRKGWHSEWGSYIFDFGRPEVRNFLVANATYWMEEFHADGLRVDGVASMLYLDYSREAGQWIPNKHGGRENLEAVALLQETNATAYRRSPGVVMIAEESTSWPGVTAPTSEGGLGFGFKWNMGWMHDTLDYLAATPFARAHQHHALTFSLVYAYSEKFILPISHDEVVHGKGSLLRKMAGDAWQKFATTRAFLGFQWSHPGKQLLFMGSEFAQVGEWADAGTLTWELTEQPEHAGVQTLVRDLNRLYAELPALWQIDHHEDGFVWLDANDADRNLYSFLRWGNEDPDGLRPAVAVLVNFSGVAHHQVHVGLPYGGRWREVLNTDAGIYGGSGQGNMGSVEAYDNPHQRQPFSALVTVPPMGAIWLVPEDTTGEEAAPALATGASSEPDSGTDSDDAESGRHPRAGTPALPEDLVDLDALLAAYAEIVPDPENLDQQVAFGTSGHRGSALDGAFNEHHILAMTQAICDYRLGQGIAGPMFLGRDTHALSEPAWRSALEVLVANRVDVRIDSAGIEGFTPTPAVSRAILAHNRETPGAVGEADGIVITPSHNPPRDGGFKYNPPHGGPADAEVTSWVADRANELLRDSLKGVLRVPFEEALTRAKAYDFMGEYVRALPRVLDLDAIREAGVRIGADPLGGAAVEYWGEIAREHDLDLSVINPDVDPAWSFMTLDWDGKIRMDCSSADAMASLIGIMGEDGAYDVATGNDADADRHGIVTADGGLMNPNHYLAVAIDYLYGGGRPDWPSGTAIGKTLVSSSMIDRVAAARERTLVEVPVGFKWFVPGLMDGSIAFGGEESAGASFLCRDGSVWSTDKDGIILALLAAEIIARTGQTPSQRYTQLLDELADGQKPAYARVDAPAGREQKARLKKLSAQDITATELAGEPITAVLTNAPGNEAAIGGIKVTTEHAWFAARPSGTEDVYKIYAESFLGAEHLAQVQAEAQQVVDAALNA